MFLKTSFLHYYAFHPTSGHANCRQSYTNVVVGKYATNNLINAMVWSLADTLIIFYSICFDYFKLSRFNFRCKFTFAWINGIPQPHRHWKFRDELLVFLKSAVSPKNYVIWISLSTFCMDPVCKSPWQQNIFFLMVCRFYSRNCVVAVSSIFVAE